MNKHNGTVAENVFPIELVTVGEGCYGALNVLSWSSSAEKRVIPDERLIIGNYVSIVSGVLFILGGNPVRVIKYKYSPEIINIVSSVNLVDLSKECIENNIALFNMKIQSVEDALYIKSKLNKKS